MKRIFVIWVSVPACSTSLEFQPSMPTHSDAKNAPSACVLGLGTVHWPPTNPYGLPAGENTVAPDQLVEVALETPAETERAASGLPPARRAGPCEMCSRCSNSGAIHSRVRAIV